MIRAEDVGYHTPTEVCYDWGETAFFSIYLPEPNITAWIYFVARNGVGAMLCDVEVIDGIGRVSLDAKYMDIQQHLPIPEKFEAFTLPNGLSVTTMNEPLGYQLDYIGVDDTEFHWSIKGLMPPFDIHDPEMDPLASPDVNASGFGAAYANHFDMTAHVTGTAKIRGKSYEVDCVTTMDHSWGPRNERGLRPMGWINGNFGKDLAFQTIWSFTPEAKGLDQFKLAHGYVMIGGEVRGLVEGQLQAPRHGPWPSGYSGNLVDAQGRNYAITGHAVAQHPWACYSNSLAMFSTIQWTLTGRTGHGLAQENWPLDMLTGKGLG